MTDNTDNIIRLAFEQDKVEAEEEEYLSSITEAVEAIGEPPIMIFDKSRSLWIPPKMRKDPVKVLGIFNKYQFLVNRIISG